MRKTAFLMLGLACVLGVVSVYLAKDWLEAQSTSDDGIELAQVVVTKQQLRVGDPLVPDALAVVPWPASARPEGSFATIEELIGKDEERRVALRTLEPNEPILKNRVSGFGGRATLSALLPDNKRAFTIRANDVVGVGGFVLPGDRVDVMLTRTTDDRSSRTDIILQNIKVLGVDQEASEDRNKPHVAKAVTLEVTATEAQKLALASTVGLITLALRNEANADTVAASVLRLDDLGTETAASKPAATSATASTKPKPSGPKYDPYAAVTVFRALESSVNKVAREPATRSSGSTSAGPDTPARKEPTKLGPQASSVPQPGAASATAVPREASFAGDDGPLAPPAGDDTAAFVGQVESALRDIENTAETR